MSDLPPPPPPPGQPPPPPAGPGAPPPGYTETYGGYGTYGAAPASFGEYAGFWSRLVAKVIDGAILGAAFVGAFVPAVIVLAAGPDRLEACTVDEEGFRDPNGQFTALCEEPTGGTIAAAILVGLLGLALLVWLYVYYFRREGRTGFTWGRKAMGMRVVDANTGSPIGGGRSFGRYLFASFISGNFFLLGYLWALWDPRKQTWHDKIATSVVVKA